jgi:hypothetical protein
MMRSPFALAWLLVFSVALGWPQTNSPQAGPGTAKTSPHGAEPDGSKSNSPQGKPTPAVANRMESNAQALPDELLLDSFIVMPAASGRLSQPPPQPQTEILDDSATNPGLSTDGHDPILDPPPLPTGMTTLVGGMVRAVDHIRNQMTIAAFAGNRWKIAFDERTHIYLNGAETTQAGIKKGERVYVDTMLDTQKHEVFARNIRLGMPVPIADADGQIIDLNASHQTVTLRDRVNSVPVHFRVDTTTRIIYGGHPVSLPDLKPGSLVHVRFSPELSNRGLAREITVVVMPGAELTYLGNITYLNMGSGVLALQDTLDQKIYEIHFDPSLAASRNLAVGAEARIVAIFEGSHYSAQSITLTRSAQGAEKEKEKE